MLVWRLDRLSRGLRHCVNVLGEFRDLGVEFVSVRDGLSFSGPLGMALYALVAALAEAEVEALRERTVAGLKNARAKGKRLGRPPTGDAKIEDIIRLKDQGVSQERIARQLGVSDGIRQPETQALQNGSKTASISPCDQRSGSALILTLQIVRFVQGAGGRGGDISLGSISVKKESHEAPVSRLRSQGKIDAFPRCYLGGEFSPKVSASETALQVTGIGKSMGEARAFGFQVCTVSHSYRCRLPSRSSRQQQFREFRRKVWVWRQVVA